MKAERYMGSIGWPFIHRPSFAVIAKITWDNEVTDSEYRVDLVEEFQEVSLQVLKARCIEATRRLAVDTWFADTGNEAMLGAFYETGGDVIGLTPPPHSGEKGLAILCFQAVIELGRAEKKIIHFGNSIIPSEILNLPQDKPVKIENIPPVAAIGYLAAGIQLWLQLETIKKPILGPARIFQLVEQGQPSEVFGLPIGMDPAVLTDEGAGFWEPDEW